AALDVMLLELPPALLELAALLDPALLGPAVLELPPLLLEPPPDPLSPLDPQPARINPAGTATAAAPAPRNTVRREISLVMFTPIRGRSGDREGGSRSRSA